jgi:peroxiredoxin
MKKGSFICTLLLVIILLTCTKHDTPSCPNFYLEDVDGNPVELHSLLADGPVFICIWALWANVAIDELDALNPYYEELDSIGLQLLAISQDKESSIPYVKPFAEDHGWKFRIVLDPDKTVVDSFNIVGLPTCFAINQEGDIPFTHMGYKSGDETMIVDTLRVLYGN